MNRGSVLIMLPRWTRDGGVAAHVQASAAALAEHGMHVRVLTALVDTGNPIPGVEVSVRPRLFEREAPVEARLGESLASPPDVVHIHQVDDPELIAHLRRSAPVVMSAHGYIACTSGVHYFRPGEECDRAHGPGCWPNLLLRGCAHTRRPQTLPAAYRQATRGLAALRGADLAISYSTAMDRHLSTNSVARRAIVPLFSTMKPRSGSGHETRRRVVFGGRVVAPKGVRVLIRAARDVDAEFVICGTGWRLDSMRSLARRHGVEQRFHFRGWLDAAALAQELAEASVVVVPSVWPEPFGLVGIEALASGRPVVASATGGIGDWLDDGVTGLAVRPGDAAGLARALEELLADPERQRTMGEAGRKMVAARFSPANHVAGLGHAYGRARTFWKSQGA
jgi:glycosyltransferase involved in cell wall biosynthesis